MFIIIIHIQLYTHMAKNKPTNLLGIPCNFIQMIKKGFNVFAHIYTSMKIQLKKTYIAKGGEKMQLGKYILMFVILPPIILGGQIEKGASHIDTSIVETVEVEESVEEVVDNQEEKDVEETIIEDQEDQQEIQEEIQIEIIKFNEQGLILREGIANEEVLRIKKFLKEKGYTDMKEDYYFDNKTRKAVTKYQQINGLNPDGVIGINTYKKINEDMKLNNISIPEVQIEIISQIPQENFIIINKSNNTLYHLKEKETIKKYPVATGKSVEYTPEGKFTIVVKYVNPAWGGAGVSKPIRGGDPNNPLGKRWMGLSIKGGGSYGIHGNSNEGSIGTYASLGCVRMFNKDVEDLYEIIPIGTSVWIGNEEKLKEFGIIFSY